MRYWVFDRENLLGCFGSFEQAEQLGELWRSHMGVPKRYIRIYSTS